MTASLECEEAECLRTRRLMLRPMRPGDAPAIAEYLTDREVTKMLARVPHPYLLRDARDFIAGHGEERVFAITDRDTSALLGLCGLKPVAGNRRAELGYWIGRPHWGKGLATEAVQAVIDHGFERLALERIDVSCRVVNEASRRVIRKCGFAFSGSGMLETVSAGRVASEHFFMDRPCWAALKAWGRG